MADPPASRGPLTAVLSAASSAMSAVICEGRRRHPCPPSSARVLARGYCRREWPTPWAEPALPTGCGQSLAPVRAVVQGGGGAAHDEGWQRPGAATGLGLGAGPRHS